MNTNEACRKRVSEGRSNLKLGARMAAVGALLAFGTVAFGSGGIAPISKDGNAFNPENWEITYQLVGHTTASTWAYISGVAQNIVYDLDWSTGIWKRNGVVLQSVPSIPFTNATYETRLVSCHSEGDITVVLHWIGIGASPTKTRILATGRATAVASQGGVPVADDGLGDPMVWTADILGLLGWDCLGAHIRTVDVSNGTGSKTFHCLADAYANGPQKACWASVGSLLAAIDGRSADIYMPVAPTNYGKLPQGQATYAYTRAIGPFTYEYVLRTYDYAVKLENPRVYSNGATVSGRWDIGLPIPRQDVIWDGEYWTVSPQQINPTLIGTTAIITSGGIGNESYAWLNGPSGLLPHNNSWSVPDFIQNWETPRSVTTAVYPQVDPYPTTVIEDHDANKVRTVGITYTWADGVTAEATREIHTHKAAELVQHLQEIVDKNLNTSYNLMALSEAVNGYVPNDVSVAHVSNPGVEGFALGATVIAFVTAIWTSLDGVDEAAAAVLAAVGSSGAFGTLLAPQPAAVLKSDYSAGGYDLPITDPINDSRFPSQIVDFDWRIDFRKRTHVFPKVMDMWGFDGYQGPPVVELEKYDDTVTQALRRYVFRFHNYNGGGGGGGNPD